MCVGKIPAYAGMLGGLYLPSSYGLDSASSTTAYLGKSVTSSMVSTSRLFAEGFKTTGSGVNMSRLCASISQSTGLKKLLRFTLPDVDIVFNSF